jgi:Asp-tRNA(Asn)/Glu-tRNA(Gln) amidotransferase A subunit family amidase
MKTEEFESYDGLGLAGLVRSGDASAAELLDAAIARVEARNPELNAVVSRLYDQARPPSPQACPMDRSPACRICSRISARTIPAR